METSKELLTRLDAVNAKLNSLHYILNVAPRSPMGLTKEESKTPQWIEAKKQWAINWAELKSINTQLNKIRKCVGFQIVNGKRVTVYKYKD